MSGIGDDACGLPHAPELNAASSRRPNVPWRTVMEVRCLLYYLVNVNVWLAAD